MWDCSPSDSWSAVPGDSCINLLCIYFSLYSDSLEILTYCRVFCLQLCQWVCLMDCPSWSAGQPAGALWVSRQWADTAYRQCISWQQLHQFWATGHPSKEAWSHLQPFMYCCNLWNSSPWPHPPSLSWPRGCSFGFWCLSAWCHWGLYVNTTTLFFLWDLYVRRQHLFCLPSL